MRYLLRIRGKELERKMDVGIRPIRAFSCGKVDRGDRLGRADTHSGGAGAGQGLSAYSTFQDPPTGKQWIRIRLAYTDPLFTCMRFVGLAGPHVTVRIPTEIEHSDRER